MEKRNYTEDQANSNCIKVEMLMSRDKSKLRIAISALFWADVDLISLDCDQCAYATD